MLALSCQVIGNVGSSTMCFLLEVPSPNSSVPFCIYSACHMFCQHFVILFLLSVVSLLLNPCMVKMGSASAYTAAMDDRADVSFPW